jgi:hypothetical protein
MLFHTKLLVIVFYIHCNVQLISGSAGTLEEVSDEDLLNLIRSENYVCVLFSKRFPRHLLPNYNFCGIFYFFPSYFSIFLLGRKDCKECDEYDDALYNIREDLVDSLNAWPKVVCVLQCVCVK